MAAPVDRTRRHVLSNSVRTHRSTVFRDLSRFHFSWSNAAAAPLARLFGGHVRGVSHSGCRRRQAYDAVLTCRAAAAEVAGIGGAMIPLDQVTVVGSNARILGFPAVGRISRLGLVPGALHLEVEKASAWPAVAIDGGDP